jgi:hypothetical protein
MALLNDRAAAHSTKNPQLLVAGVVERTDRLCPVIANGLDWAAFLGFLAASFFLRRPWLLGNVRITAIFVAFKIIRRSLATQIAVNALVIYVVLARNVFRIFVCSVSHKVFYFGSAIWQPPRAMARAFRVFHSGCCQSRLD